MLNEDAQDLKGALQTIMVNHEGDETKFHLDRQKLSDLLPAIGMVVAGYDLRLSVKLIPDQVSVETKEELEDVGFRDDIVHVSVDRNRTPRFFEDDNSKMVIPEPNREWIRDPEEFEEKPKTELLVQMLESGTTSSDIEVPKLHFPFELGAMGKYIQSRDIRLSAGPFNRSDEDSMKIEVEEIEPMDLMASGFGGIIGGMLG